MNKEEIAVAVTRAAARFGLVMIHPSSLRKLGSGKYIFPNPVYRVRLEDGRGPTEYARDNFEWLPVMQELRKTKGKSSPLFDALLEEGFTLIRVAKLHFYDSALTLELA